MPGNIKGIVVEFAGDTSKLDASIRNVNKETRALDNELRKVNNALKFNPGNISLLGQKQEILKQKISETTNKLQMLKEKQKQMDAAGVDKNSKAYRELQREIITTQSKLKGLNAEMLRVKTQLNPVYRMGQAWQAAGKKITAAGQRIRSVSRAGAVVAGAMGVAAYKTGRFADDIRTMSKQYGISTKNLQKYKLSADLVDVSVEDIAKSQMKLKRNMLSADQGSKNQAAAFKELGINIKDSTGKMKDGEVIFDEVVAALSQMEDGTRRDALAMQLMGKSAANLNPLIQDGGETYKKTAELMKKYGLNFLSEKELKRANEFNDKIDRMKAVGTVAFQALGMKIIDFLAPELEKLVGLVGKVSKWFSNLSPVVLKIAGVISVVTAAASPFLIVFGKIVGVIGGVMMKIGALFVKFQALGGAAGVVAKGTALIGKAVALLSNPIGIAVAAVLALIGVITYLYKTNEGVRKSVNSFAKTVVKTFGSLASAVMPELKKAVKDIGKAFNQLMQAIAPLVRIYLTMLQKKLEVIGKVLKVLLPFVVRVVKTAIMTSIGLLRTLLTIVTTVLKMIGTVVKAWVKLIVSYYKGAFDLVKQMTNKWKAFFIMAWNAIKTAATAAWNGIKNAIVNPFKAAVSGVKTVVTAIRNFMSTAWNTVKARAASAWNGIKTVITAPLRAAKNVVVSLINGIKSAFSKIGSVAAAPFNKAKKTIQGFVNTIKKLFPFDLGKIFKFKIPKISISGGKAPWGIAGKGKLPKFSVKWNKLGGIFKQPTIFNTKSGLQGVGEAGAEAVLPLDLLWEHMDKMANKIAGASTGNMVVNVYGSDGMDVNELAKAVEQRIIQAEKRRKEAWA